MVNRKILTRRIAVLLAAFALVGAFASTAMSQEDFEEHPHMMVLGLQLDDEGEPIGFRKCVDLANNQAQPLGSHHANLHFGPAGEALFVHGGHAVVPGAPFPAPFADPVPWSDCESLIAFFFGD